MDLVCSGYKLDTTRFVADPLPGESCECWLSCKGRDVDEKGI